MRRDLGVLDGGTAGFVYNAKLNDKILSFTISGANPDVDTLAREDLIDTGGDQIYLQTASVLTLVSASAQDNPAGSGLGNVTIVGLDPLWDIKTVNYDLDGITPVVTTEEFIRVFYIIGTNDSLVATPNVGAAGAISCSAGANLQGTILIGNTTTRMASFSIPRGYTGNISLAFVAAAKADNFIVGFYLRTFGSTFASRNDFEVADGNFVAINFDPMTGNLPEKSDIKFRAQSLAVNSSVRGSFVIEIIRNDYLNSLAESI